MLIQIKVQILTKKSHFKTFVYVSYDMYNFMIRYDSYDTHTVSYDSWTLMICRYDTKLFTHDSIRIVRYVSYDTYRASYDTDNYGWIFFILLILFGYGLVETFYLFIIQWLGIGASREFELWMSQLEILGGTNSN